MDRNPFNVAATIWRTTGHSVPRQVEYINIFTTHGRTHENLPLHTGQTVRVCIAPALECHHQFDFLILLD